MIGKKPLAFLATFLITIPAYAQQSGYVGMHHLKPKPAPTSPAPAVADESEPTEDTDIPTLPTYKPLSPKDALVKPEDLEKWNHMTEAALANTPVEIEALIHIIESDRGAVSPQGLFLAAKSLADKKMMQQAALYYFVGQLRLSFDEARWPATTNKEDVQRRAQENKKSPDQAAPNLESAPRIDDPHQGIKSLSNQIGAPIISWVLKDKARMDKMIKQVKDWDASCVYAYLPDYDLSEPAPFEKWEKLLERTREDYFTQIIQWSNVMSKVRR